MLWKVNCSCSACHVTEYRLSLFEALLPDTFIRNRLHSESKVCLHLFCSRIGRHLRNSVMVQTKLLHQDTHREVQGEASKWILNIWGDNKISSGESWRSPKSSAEEWLQEAFSGCQKQLLVLEGSGLLHCGSSVLPLFLHLTVAAAPPGRLFYCYQSCFKDKNQASDKLVACLRLHRSGPKAPVVWVQNLLPNHCGISVFWKRIQVAKDRTCKK